MPQVIEELEEVLAFNELLTKLRNHPEASQFAPGVGPVSVIGTLGCLSSSSCLMNWRVQMPPFFVPPLCLRF